MEESYSRDIPRESRDIPREPREPRESRHRSEKLQKVEEETDYMSLLSNKYVMIALVIIALILFATYYMYKELTNIKQYIYQQSLIEQQNKLELEQIDQKINKITSVFKSITQNTMIPQTFHQKQQNQIKQIEKLEEEEEEDEDEEGDVSDAPEINIL